MARTINGESWETILEELRKHEPKEGSKEGKPFYKIEQYRKRLNEVLGLNFSTVYSEPNYMLLNSGQEIVSLLCTLTIRDDDGNVVCQSSGYGGKPIQYSDTGLCYTAHLTPAFVQAAALSQACKDIGLFGDVDDDFIPDDTDGPKKAGNGTRSYEKNSSSVEECVAFLLYSPFRTHTDKNKQTNYYLNAIREDTGEKVELIFYGNDMKKPEHQKNFKTIFDSVSNLAAGKKCRATLLCKKGSKGGYIVKGFKGA